jgi:DNA (cytosine-5)-methyltransferase 1
MTIVYENHMQDSRVKECGQCSPQINAKAGTGGGNLPLVQAIGYYPSQYQSPRECETPTLTAGNCSHIRGDTPLVQSIAIAENIIGRKVENGGNGVGAQEEVAYTLNATGVMGVSQNETVRRLTPVECERLMGFPDNWTRIPWKLYQECVRKGWSFEAELEKRGKKLKTTVDDCPDSPRYKACGNSMCVNVMRWIGMRIELVERKGTLC